MANSRRVFRVGERVRSVVATALTRLADPRLAMVTITSAVVSPDLRHARIYWIAGGDAERLAEVSAGFESAGGHLRRILGKELGVRFVPEVKFFYDDTFDTNDEVERLLRQVRKNTPTEDDQEEQLESDQTGAKG